MKEDEERRSLARRKLKGVVLGALPAVRTAVLTPLASKPDRSMLGWLLWNESREKGREREE